jgi:hypothetical protein
VKYLKIRLIICCYFTNKDELPGSITESTMESASRAGENMIGCFPDLPSSSSRQQSDFHPRPINPCKKKQRRDMNLKFV